MVSAQHFERVNQSERGVSEGERERQGERGETERETEEEKTASAAALQWNTLLCLREAERALSLSRSTPTDQRALSVPGAHCSGSKTGNMKVSLPPVMCR